MACRISKVTDKKTGRSLRIHSTRCSDYSGVLLDALNLSRDTSTTSVAVIARCNGQYYTDMYGLSDELQAGIALLQHKLITDWSDG